VPHHEVVLLGELGHDTSMELIQRREILGLYQLRVTQPQELIADHEQDAAPPSLVEPLLPSELETMRRVVERMNVVRQEGAARLTREVGGEKRHAATRISRDYSTLKLRHRYRWRRHRPAPLPVLGKLDTMLGLTEDDRVGVMQPSTAAITTRSIR